MARLMWRVSLSAWLTVALAVVVTATDQSSTTRDRIKSMFVAKGKTIEQIENTPSGDRSKREVNRLARFYVEELDEKSDEKSEDELEGLMEKLEQFRNDHGDGILLKNGLSSAWIDLLSLRSKKLDCQGSIISDVSKFAANAKLLRRQFELASESFREHLVECRFEEVFKEALEKVKQSSPEDSDLDKHGTLNGYLVDEFWPLVAGAKEREIEDELKSMLRNIGLFSSFKSISNERDCTDRLESQLTELLVNSNRAYPMPYKFVNAYFALYLNVCGYEKLFRKRVEHMNQRSFGHWDLVKYATLHSYITQFLANKQNRLKPRNQLFRTVRWMLSVMRELSVLESISSKAECRAELNGLVTALKQAWQNGLPMFMLVKDYFALYLEKCGFEKHFEKAISNIKPNSNELSGPGVESTLDSFLGGEFWSQADIERLGQQMAYMLPVIEELSKLEPKSKETYCTEKLETNLIERLVYSRGIPKLQQLVGKYFSLYLDTCGIEEILAKGLELMRQSSHEDWNLDQYPTVYSYIMDLVAVSRFEHKSVVTAKLSWIVSTVRELSKLEGISKKTDCTKEHKSNLVTNLVSTKPLYSPLHELTKAYFGLYLAKCGFEEQFKKATKNIEENSDEHWDNYSTLDDYLRAQLWPRVSKNEHIISFELDQVLSMFVELSELRPMSKETHCTAESEVSLIKHLVHSRKLHGPIKYYFKLFLNECGYERLFTKRVEHMTQGPLKLWDPVKYPTLYSYITWILSEPGSGNELSGALIWMVSKLRELSVLESISKQSDCTEELQTELLKALDKRDKHSTSLISDYFSLYLDKCGFEENVKKISKIKPNRLWSSGKYRTLYIYFVSREFSNISELSLILSALKEFSTLERISDQTECSELLKTNLVNGLDSSRVHYVELHSLMRAFFELYLDKCGFQERFKRVVNKDKAPTSKGDLHLANFLLDIVPDAANKNQGDLGKYILFALNILSELPDSGASNCDGKAASLILELKINSAKLGREKSEAFSSAIASRYLKGCAEHFRAKAKDFKGSRADKWNFIKKSVDVIVEHRDEEFSSVKSTVIPQLAVKMSGGDGINDKQASANFFRKLRDNCEDLLKFMSPTMDQTKLDVELIKNDAEIIDFMNYISVCSKVTGGQHMGMQLIFEKTGMPFYTKT